MRGNLFFFSVAGFCFGVSICTIYVIPVAIIFPCFILLTFFIGAWVLEKQMYQLACVIFLVGALTGGVRTSYVQKVIPYAFVSILNTNVSMQGVVSAPPDVRQKNIRVVVEVKRGAAHTRIIAVVRSTSHIQVGEEVEISGKVQSPEPFDSDGGRTFAYDMFLAKDGVFALMPYASIKVLKAPTYEYWTWGALVSLNGAVERAIQHAVPTPYSSLAIGILLGGKQGLGDELLKIFGIAGLLQIVVLSGYNVTIVADAILRILKGMPKVMGSILAAVGVCLFVVAAGAGSSAVRAAIMSIFSLTARATNRTYAVLRALCTALVAMILYNPLLLVYDPGFQLSFLATIGLVVGSPLLEKRLMWIKSVTLRGLGATTFAAQIAVLPILLYQSGNLSLVAIPANIFTSPLVPFAMAFSAIAAGSSFIMPAFATYIGVPAYICLWWIIEIAKISASIPYANVILPAFPFWVVALVYALLGVLVWNLKRSAIR